jgi:hypothetical protein
MDNMYAVTYMFNGIQHTVDVRASSEAQAAWLVCSRTLFGTEFIAIHLVPAVSSSPAPGNGDRSYGAALREIQGDPNDY